MNKSNDLVYEQENELNGKHLQWNKTIKMVSFFSLFLSRSIAKSLVV